MVQGWSLTSTKVPAVFDDANRYGSPGLPRSGSRGIFGLPLVSFPGVAFGTNPSLSTISKPSQEFQAVSNLPLPRVAASGRANSNRRLFAC
jgi:hypothetical protein